MTRKHYRVIAAALRKNRPAEDSNALDVEMPYFEGIVRDIAEAMAVDNPRFDLVKFNKACGL